MRNTSAVLDGIHRQLVEMHCNVDQPSATERRRITENSKDVTAFNTKLREVANAAKYITSTGSVISGLVSISADNGSHMLVFCCR